jgi:hypothetical protein
LDFFTSVDGVAANAGRQEAGSPKEGYWATPMDVGERVEKVDVDWLGLG